LISRRDKEPHPNDFDANRIAAANNLQFLDRQMRAEEEAA
jgi:hypothetical protein